jgi:hypothetical protein
METIILPENPLEKQHGFSSSVSSLKTTKEGLIAILNRYYFAVISFTITVASITGAIATMYIFENGAPEWMVVVCIFSTMMNNVASIAQVPIRWLVRIFITVLFLQGLMTLFSFMG